MTRDTLITAILNDMYVKNENGKPDAYIRANIYKRWHGWLNRQTKADLETIYSNRKIGK